MNMNIEGVLTLQLLNTCIEFVPCMHYHQNGGTCTVPRVRDDVSRYWLEATAERILRNGELCHVRGCSTQIRFASAYAEPGYDVPEKDILFADWNNAKERAPEPRYWSDVDRVNEMASELLEAVGYALEWEDEWSTCADCGKAVRTGPDGWDWTPGYVIVDDCELLCMECAPEPEPEPENDDDDDDDTHE